MDKVANLVSYCLYLNKPPHIIHSERQYKLNHSLVVIQYVCSCVITTLIIHYSISHQLKAHLSYRPGVPASC